MGNFGDGDVAAQVSYFNRPVNINAIIL